MVELLNSELQGVDRAVVTETLSAGLAVFGEAGDTALATYTPALPWVHEQSNTFSNHLISNKKVDATNTVIGAMNDGLSLPEVSVGLIQPAMYEIGRLWQINELTVAQEHRATAICQSILSIAFGHAEFKENAGRRAVLACIEGNYHSLGLRMIGDALEIEGWEVDYLGANTPTETLVQTIDGGDFDLVGLSVSMHDQVQSLVDIVDQLRGELGNDCPSILVGGLAINTNPELLDSMGLVYWVPNAVLIAKEGI